MALRRSRKYLSCFYCGKRSNLQFDGRLSFVCAYCDATNWLDKHGDITDPPCAIEKSDPAPALSTRYATPQVSFRSPSPSLPPEGESLDSIFCATCLKNQKMFMDGASEFELPDDPREPEYATRLKGYRRWRKNFEQNHPQICADCEPNVQEQLDKASYTAKTDHLRRMMDRTKAQRKEVKKRGMLDFVDLAGKWSWNIAFFLQLIWHISIIGTIVTEQQFLQGQSEHRLLALLQSICESALHAVPSSDRLIRWTITISMTSFPWNPRFKQTIRGFTSHILGLRQWYTYQLVTMLVRFVSLFVAQYGDAKGLQPMAQLGAHMAIAFMMSYVYQVAAKSIRTDTTPLFGPNRPLRQSQSSQSELQKDPNDLGTVLDDILNEPTSRVVDSSNSSQPRSSSLRHRGTTRPTQNESFGAPTQQIQPHTSFGSLALSNSPPQSQSAPAEAYYSDEMDWSPSGSQHRAFSNHNPFRIKNPHPRFSDVPIEEKSGPFWYKVPPAPTNPARRLRNPPIQPVIRESPKEKKEIFFQSSSRGPLNMGSSSQDSDIIFKEAKFHAPGPTDDPRDGLLRMMGSFSISPDPDDRMTRAARSKNGSRVFDSDETTFGVQDNSKTRGAELVLLIGALWAWIAALGTAESYGPTLGLGAVCACLFVSTRLAADLLVDVQIREGKQPSVFSLSWANLGLAQVIAALLLLWQLWAGISNGITCGTYGNALFGIVIIHQVWHVFG